jgi:hypothetical protein
VIGSAAKFGGGGGGFGPPLPPPPHEANMAEAMITVGIEFRQILTVLLLCWKGKQIDAWQSWA